MMIKNNWGITLLLLFSCTVYGQDIVDINLNVKHSVGGVSKFDRSKYIIFHDGINSNEWESNTQKKDFFDGLDVYLGRNNGSMVWEWNQVEEDPDKSGWPSINHMISRGQSNKSSYASKTFDHQFENRLPYMMFGGQEHIYPHGQKTNPQSNSQSPWEYQGFEATAEFYANYFKYYFGTGGSTGHPKPLMLEVTNEPFVKASSLGTTKLEMAKFHNSVAKRVKELNPNMMVGGYSAAHPMFEAGDFGLWESTWKMFIDVAGENMDFFSFHLYDGNSKYGNGQYKRSGSNIEAIMDMINHYSTIRLGKTLPFSVSEFGDLPCKDCNDDPYSPANDWYNIRSFNNMMLQLMERPDQILNAIPFVLLKARWAHPEGMEYNNYSSRLMRELGEMPGETPHGGYIYTHILQFFEMWSNVNGTRIDTKSVDLDLLTDAYVDGNKMYLILSNLNWEDRIVKLNFMDAYAANVQRIFIQHSYAVNNVPQLDKSTVNKAIDQVKIGAEGTIILEYTFDKALTIDELSEEKTYFADKYFQNIVANNTDTFTIDNVETAAHGEAILRLGLGRDHGRSLKPNLKINDFEVEVPDDWRGYDQKTRDRFFGVLEIPVPYNALLKSNTIEVTFPDDNGHITSLALKVYNFSKEIPRSEKQLVAINVSPETKISKPGKRFQLSASALPEEFQEGLNETWASTNPSIAAVDTNGWVTTYKEGEVQIVASNADKTVNGICTLTVSNNAPPVLATSLNIEPKTPVIKNPGTLQLRAYFTPNDIDDTTLQWKSEDESIATVDENGLVTAVAKGTVEITGTTKDGSNLSKSLTLSVPKYTSTASCSGVAAVYKQSTSHTIQVPYSVGESKDILVYISKLNDFNAIAQGRLTVEKGSGTAEVKVDLGQMLEPGEYTIWVRVTKVGGSWTIATSTCSTTTTIEKSNSVDNTELSNIQLFPNPTKEKLIVKGLSGNENQVKVFGVDGKLYFEQNKISSTEIVVPMESFKPGYYIVKVRGASASATFKISKI